MWRLRLVLRRINKEKWFRRIVIALTCVCVLSYTVFHISSLFAEEINTIVVGPTSETSSVSLDGYIFRDSALVNSNYSGAVDYLTADGEKIAVGTELAKVYEGGAQASRNILSVIDAQIELLRMSTENDYGESDISYLRQSASNAYYSIMKQLSDGDLSTLYSDGERLLVAMNSLARLKDDSFAIGDKLSELYAAREQIFASSGANETVSADQSGYFYVNTDGYESIFTGEAARTLDGDSLDKLMKNSVAQSTPDTCVGKLSTSPKWYFATSVGADVLGNFEEGNTYRLFFTDGGAYNIDMCLERVLECGESGGYTLVFGSSVIPRGFSFSRHQTVRLETESVSGIYVPMSAVRYEGRERVVYILKGSVVQRRLIEIVYEGADYYIVADGVTSEDGIYLQSNDLLITGGANLFDGRILD